MERAGALINRLVEQYQQNAGADRMLVTLHILAAELELEKNKTGQKGKSVSVVAPAMAQRRELIEEIPAPVPVATKPPAVPAPEVKQPLAEPQVQLNVPVFSKPAPAFIYAPSKTDAGPAQGAAVVHELNEVMARKEESLNERLKTNNVELGSTLQSSPVRDLKRAIGINDRYVFLNELFRGDEVMYERSIKTINSFSIFAEADYWIKRELKSKLGWNDEAPAVALFDQLVRRRFS